MALGIGTHGSVSSVGTGYAVVGPATKLPVFRLVGTSFGHVIARPGTLLRLSLGWIALSYGAGLLLQHGLGMPPPAAWGIANVLSSVGQMAVLVAWGRLLLLDERPTSWMAPFDRRAFRVFWRGVGLTILVTVAIALIVAVSGGAAYLLDPSGRAINGIQHYWLVPAVAGSVLAMIAALRLYPFVIAPALDDRRMSLADAWRTTRRHTARLISISLLTTLALVLVMGGGIFLAVLAVTDFGTVQGVLRLPSDGGPLEAGTLALDLVAWGAAYGFTAVLASLWTQIYHRLVP